MFVYVPPPPPSPEARDLGAKVAQLVRLLRQENPDLSPSDIRRGLELARRELRPEIGGPSRQLIAMIVALVLGVVFFVGLSVSSSGLQPKVLMIAIGALVAGLGLFVAVASRR